MTRAGSVNNAVVNTMIAFIIVASTHYYSDFNMGEMGRDEPVMGQRSNIRFRATSSMVGGPFFADPMMSGNARRRPPEREKIRTETR